MQKPSSLKGQAIFSNRLHQFGCYDWLDAADGDLSTAVVAVTTESAITDAYPAVLFTASRVSASRSVDNTICAVESAQSHRPPIESYEIQLSSTSVQQDIQLPSGLIQRVWSQSKQPQQTDQSVMLLQSQQLTQYLELVQQQSTAKLQPSYSLPMESQSIHEMSRSVQCTTAIGSTSVDSAISSAIQVNRSICSTDPTTTGTISTRAAIGYTNSANATTIIGKVRMDTVITGVARRVAIAIKSVSASVTIGSEKPVILSTLSADLTIVGSKTSTRTDTIARIGGVAFAESPGF
ncbi:OLC1v1024473C1 [Oldenlandia corymbosa var. corymbosa]|uniref:OLC1v1024473C1 n=1 Tax=Oldenlandia corymbosa var. corymbosa TaxID=529605 RepID=A0AAV1C595_OLDCO|nr:OLC1v1024473C1 [Oldenlandia corymbosa var. corymbosa]